MLSPDLILAKGDHLASGSRPKAQISLVRQDKAGELNLQEISAQALIQLSNSMYEPRRTRRSHLVKEGMLGGGVLEDTKDTGEHELLLAKIR